MSGSNTISFDDIPSGPAPAVPPAAVASPSPKTTTISFDDIPAASTPPVKLPDGWVDGDPLPDPATAAPQTTENPRGAKDPGFPFDKPGVTYGSFLPVAKNPDGSFSVAAPEFVRSIFRGEQSMWDRAAGMAAGKNMGPESGDEIGFASLGVGGGMSGRMFGGAPLAAAADPLHGIPAIAIGDTAKANKVSQQAAAVIAKRVAADVKGGGTTAEDVMENLNKAKASGKPLTLMDVGGDNLRSLTGSIGRTAGAAKTVMRNFLTKRDDAAYERITSDVGKHIADSPLRQAGIDLIEKRSVEGQPLWEKAMRGGSMAPLETHFQTAWRNTTAELGEAQKAEAAASTALTLAKAKVARAGEDVYSNNVALRQESEAQAAYTRAVGDRQKIEARRSDDLDRLRRAQSDGTAHAPGAVWSPRLQQFLDQPKVQEGIRRGMALEKERAVTAGKPFNPHDYAITGTDEEGNPVVGAVPNMKVLAVAKEGIDAMLDSGQYSNELTGKLNKAGVSLAEFQKQFVSELDRLNPDYSAARENWAGHSASIRALRDGQRHFQVSPEEGAARVGDLKGDAKQHYKIGVAETLRKAVLSRGWSADEAKAVFKSPWMKMQMRPLFDSDADYQRFADAITHERMMFDTKHAAMGGSQTAERRADDNELLGGVLDVAHAGMHAAAGNHMTAARSMWNIFARYRNRPIPPDVAEEIARMLTDTKIQDNLAGNRTLMGALGTPLPTPPPMAGLSPYEQGDALYLATHPMQALNPGQNQQQSGQ